MWVISWALSKCLTLVVCRAANIRVHGRTACRQSLFVRKSRAYPEDSPAGKTDAAMYDRLWSLQS